MSAFVERYSKILNFEFEWSAHYLAEVPPVSSDPPLITSDLICKALNKMKSGKGSGLSGIIAEIL